MGFVSRITDRALLEGVAEGKEPIGSVLSAERFKDLPKTLRYAAALAYCLLAASILSHVPRTWKLLTGPASRPWMASGIIALSFLLAWWMLKSAYELLWAGSDGEKLPSLRAPAPAPFGQRYAVVPIYWVGAVLCLVVAYFFDGDLVQRSAMVLASVAIGGEAYRTRAEERRAARESSQVTGREAPRLVGDAATGVRDADAVRQHEEG